MTVGILTRVRAGYPPLSPVHAHKTTSREAELVIDLRPLALGSHPLTQFRQSPQALISPMLSLQGNV